MTALISLNNISYRYPLTANQTLQDISFSVDEGTILGIVGVNGSGKTTLCNVIRSFIPNFYQGDLQGSVTIADKPLTSYSETELSQLVGYIFQNPFTQISGVKDTVREEIGYGLENLGQPADIINQRVDDAIDLLGLTAIQDKNPFALSGGQKQLVAIAAILAIDPKIFIFDEPTSQLDPAVTNQIFSIIDQLKQKNKTIIIVEHKLDLMMKYIDKLLILNTDGSLLSFGDPRKTLANITDTTAITLPTATQIYRQLPTSASTSSTTVPVTQDDIVETLNPLIRKSGV